MTGQAITTTTLLRTRRQHLKITASKKKKEVRPTHALIDAFYQHVSRTVTHPVTARSRHDAFECITASYTIDHGWARHYPTTAELTLDLTPALARELVPVDSPTPIYDWSQLTDRQIITDEAAWPDWPRLYVAKPGHLARGGEPFGWVIAGDKPRSGTLRVKRPGTDQNLPYADVTALLTAGWRVRRKEQRP